MSRIAERFAACRRAGRTALIPYVTAGDPSPATTEELLHDMVAAGADLVEVGIPFSDPQSDGPVIQEACQRALAQGVDLHRVLEIVSRFRQRDRETPVILMGYSNPIEAMGVEAFAAGAAEAGVDGVIAVDAPPEEGEELFAALTGQGIDPIFLVAPTTSEERVARICTTARGFVYYVSLKGVTGAATLAPQEMAAMLERIREHTDLPVGVGFGIRDADSAARVGELADAVVVGSALVSRIAEHGGDSERMREAVAAFIAELRAALDRSA